VGRTLIVGDLHGCAQEFDDLLTLLRYAQGVDRLVLVGDLVARGPDSAGVIDRAAKYGAEAVRGNHDEKVLSWWRVAQRAGRRRASQLVPLSEKHEQVVRTLRPEHYKLLDSLHWTLPLPAHGILVVHAGVDPTRPPEETPRDLMVSIRSVDEQGAATRKLLGTPWARVWPGPQHVVFGHDARRNLQLEANATGLDTGCCYGRALSALVLDENEPIPSAPEARRARIHSVPARAAWCPMGSGDGPE
jgi:hypothetical protein